MGEAKRRNKVARDIEAGWRERVQAGEFAGGEPATTVAHACVVIDKSQRGLDALQRLRVMPEFAPLHAELSADAPALQMWQASSLFTFAVVYCHRGAGRAHTLLAADEAWLLRESLPRALHRGAGEPPVGLLWGGDEARHAALQDRIESLRTG